MSMMASTPINIKNNNASGTFPYTLQPQPPSHPKTTGGKRGPSAPINIPAWAKGVSEDDHSDGEDSDISITDHSPPTQHSPMSSSPATASINTSGRGLAGLGQVPSPRGLTTLAAPVPTLGKKISHGVTSPRTLQNNNNTVTLNLNHQASIGLTASPSNSSPSSSGISLPSTTPVLVFHTSKVSSTADSNSNSSSNTNGANVTSSGLPVPGNGILTPSYCNATGATGLTTSHPPAPWIVSQSNKPSNQGPTTLLVSKVPKLVENSIQAKEGLGASTIKIQKVADNVAPVNTFTDTPNSDQITHSTSSSAVQQNVNVIKAATTVNNCLVVGIPENQASGKNLDTINPPVGPLLSPSDVRTGSPAEGDVHPCSPTSSSSNSCFAYELDHDYDNVASPSSSTASGPIYVRQPGFKHHAHEVIATSGNSSSSAASAAQPQLTLFSTAPASGNGNNSFRLKQKKKCSATLVNLREGYKTREATPPKLKPKREPLPMKLRALPQSFWQQPNVAHQVSPATLFPVLPPLANKDSEEALMDIRPVTPPEERDATRKGQAPERKVTVANTHLLSKLFEVVLDDKKSSVHKVRQQHKPARKAMPKSNTKGLFHGNDPYMVDAVTEKIFPQLTLEGGTRNHGYQTGAGNSSLQLISLKEGDRTVQLPSLSMEQNYPQMLSELVMHI